MNSKKMKIGYCFTGSFCTIDKSIEQLAKLVEAGHEVFPIMSPIVYTTDTRFATARENIDAVTTLCGKDIMYNIHQVEPIGPENYLDILVVLPCTGNTLGKFVNGIYDTSVTLAIKAQLRNKKPVVLGVATNDGLANSASNIGKAMNIPNLYLVPLAQDDPQNKPDSLVADFSLLDRTIELAMKNSKLQPQVF